MVSKKIIDKIYLDKDYPPLTINVGTNFNDLYNLDNENNIESKLTQYYVNKSLFSEIHKNNNNKDQTIYIFKNLNKYLNNKEKRIIKLLDRRYSPLEISLKLKISRQYYYICFKKIKKIIIKLQQQYFLINKDVN